MTNSIVFIILAGSGYLIFLAAQNANESNEFGSQFSLENLGVNTIINFFRSFQACREKNATIFMWILFLHVQLQIVILLRNFLIPLIFKFIARYEQFHPRTALKLRLFR